MLPQVQRIASRQNPLVARFRAGARGAAPGLILLDGAHLVQEAIGAGVRLRHVAIAAESADAADLADLIRALTRSSAELAIATAPVMAAMSPMRTPGAVIALAERPDSGDVYGARPLVIVAADVQDPGNIGAIVRVAEAAGASGVVAAGRSADPFGWKALRGSMGSALRLPLRRAPDTEQAVADARRHGCRIVAAVPRGGAAPAGAHLAEACAVLIGGEGAGLPDAVIASADERLTVPMEPPVESLNAAVTAAVIAYEARRQRHTAASIG